jgi:phosphoenolpyruvate-protein phosphotransferase
MPLTEKLVQTIEELPALLERHSNLDDFLKDLADLIMTRSEAEFCSIYVYDKASARLMLRAETSAGFNGDAPPRVADDLYKRAFQGLASLRGSMEATDAGSTFASYLIVPVRHGPTHIGVVALYHRNIDFFSYSDEQALKTIASRIAVSMENASLLMGLHQRERGSEDRVVARDTETVFYGMTVSPGFASGKALLLEGYPAPSQSISDEYRGSVSSLELFESSLEKTYRQLEQLLDESESRLSDVASLIFGAHFLMLRDESFTGEMREHVRNGTSPDEAIRRVVSRYAELFESMNEPRQREKSQDVRDLGYRLLRNLDPAVEEDGDYRGQIAVAEDIFPSEIVKLAVQKIDGVVFIGQAATAHISILARSLSLPVLVIQDRSLAAIEQGAPILLDAAAGRLYLYPTRQRLSKLRTSKISITSVKSKPQPHSDVRVRVMANINIFNDAQVASELEADGIGLYRSEFPFILRRDFLTEEEQYLIYRRIVKPLSGKEIVLRTADIGGDKLVDIASEAESNPFLGVRGIRFSLANREIFRDQLRAFLRAGTGEDLGIMFPMVSTVEEIEEAREEIALCLEHLAARGVPHNPHPKIGAMIELPSAVEAVSELSALTDFLSIGTNDLVMYILGVDRTNERLSELYRSYHPAVLQGLRRIVEGVGDKIEELSVCGDAASDPKMIPFFTGIGIQKLSVVPRLIPSVRSTAAGFSLERASRISNEMLSIRSVRDMTGYMETITADPQAEI